jgi:AcrR family transcriptional regulator
MPRDKTETHEKIIPCAEKEFLDKGFEKASMRTIATNAGMSAAGLYRHFESKEAMFEALVLPAVEGIKELLLSLQGEFFKLPADTQKKVVKDYSDDIFPLLIEYIYEHFDAFKLLTKCSNGTPYENLIHDLVEIDVKNSLKFIGSMNNDMLTSGRCTPELMHILSSAFYSGIFEVVIHDMTRKDADNHIARLRRFFAAGWATILQP